MVGARTSSRSLRRRQLARAGQLALGVVSKEDDDGSLAFFPPLLSAGDVKTSSSSSLMGSLGSRVASRTAPANRLLLDPSRRSLHR